MESYNFFQTHSTILNDINWWKVCDTKSLTEFNIFGQSDDQVRIPDVKAIGSGRVD